MLRGRGSEDPVALGSEARELELREGDGDDACVEARRACDVVGRTRERREHLLGWAVDARRRTGFTRETDKLEDVVGGRARSRAEPP